jgi:quercetin dioxygenase-like cupin family protein
LTLSLSEHPDGVRTEAGARVVYDLVRDEAHLGQAAVDGPALVWEVEGLPGPGEWVVRCDRVDFPPGGVAHRHVHPGPGIRRLLHGELELDRGGDARTYRAGEWWHEDADDPVLATASATEPTAFVRVLVLPAEWAGRRTIRYVDPADEEKPKLQRARILLEEPLRL